MDLRRISAPLTSEQKLAVVTLEQAKAQERVLHTAEDALISGYIETAFDHLHGPQGWLNGYCLLEETFAFSPDGLGSTCELPLRPVDDEDATVLSRRLARGDYTDFTAGEFAVSRYDEIGSAAVARLTNVGFTPQVDVVDSREYRITFKAGHASADEVPSPLKQAILLLAGHWYQNREATISDPRVTNVSKKVEYGLTALAGRYRVSPDHS